MSFPVGNGAFLPVALRERPVQTGVIRTPGTYRLHSASICSSAFSMKGHPSCLRCWSVSAEAEVIEVLVVVTVCCPVIVAEVSKV